MERVSVLVRLPRDLRRQIKVAAAERELSLNDAIVAALVAYLSGPKGVEL